MANGGSALGATRLVSVGLVAVLLLSGRASAQDAPSQDGWRFQVTPYLWAAGFGGDVRLGRRVPSFRVDESFGDVLGDLDAGFFLTGPAIRDRLVLAADLSYVAVSRKGELLASPPISAKGSLDQFSTTLLGGYRHLAVDYREGGRRFDFELSGPVFGVTYRF